jgi:drug/metabolite transporter (DMT)-like permease
MPHRHGKHSPRNLDERLRRMLAIRFCRGELHTPRLRPPAEFLVSTTRANRRGMFALAGAMATFSINDTLMKLTAQRYPLGEVITVRGIMATLLVGGCLIAMGHLTHLRAAFQPQVLTRTAFDGAAMVLFTTALIHMPLAELSAINLVSPLMITALAVIFFAEEVGWRRWTAILIGFVGTMFIVKPSPASFNAWALLGIACAFAGACRDVITRNLHAAIPTIVISFMAAAGSAIIGAMMGVIEDWQPMAPADLGALTIAAVFLGIGHYLVVIAFRGVDVAAIAPFRYTLLIWAGVLGYLAFGEMPDRYAILGSLLIVGSGLYALHREVVRQRTIAADVPPGEPGA